MGFDDYSLVILIGFLGSVIIFYGLTERYCSSDIRKEESYKVSNYLIFSGSFLLLFDLPLFLIESGYEIYGFSPFLFPIFIGGYFITLALKFPKIYDDLQKIRALKLADEIYLDRVERLKLSDLFLNRYKFTARMIDKHGKKRTAKIYLFSLFSTWIGIMIVFIYPPSLGLCSFIIIVALVMALYLYLYKKTVETFSDAMRLVNRWEGLEKYNP